MFQQVDNSVSRLIKGKHSRYVLFFMAFIYSLVLFVYGVTEILLNNLDFLHSVFLQKLNNRSILFIFIKKLL